MPVMNCMQLHANMNLYRKISGWNLSKRSIGVSNAFANSPMPGKS